MEFDTFIQTKPGVFKGILSTGELIDVSYANKHLLILMNDEIVFDEAANIPISGDIASSVLSFIEENLDRVEEDVGEYKVTRKGINIVEKELYPRVLLGDILEDINATLIACYCEQFADSKRKKKFVDVLNNYLENHVSGDE